MRNLLVAFIAITLCTNSVRAEVVEMVNGERLIGTVISLDATRLQLDSESLGMMAIQRANVATIWLQDPPHSNQRTKAAGLPAELHSPASEILKQLQSTGAIHGKELEQLKDQLPLLQSPEVKEYVVDKIGGLLSGRLSIDDIRRDAKKARDQIDDLQQSMGPQATSSLDAYLSILDDFLEKTDDDTAAGRSVPSNENQ